MTGDEPQGAMRRVQLSPSRLLLHAHFHRERETFGYEAGRIKRVYVNRGLTVQCPNSGIFIP